MVGGGVGGEVREGIGELGGCGKWTAGGLGREKPQKWGREVRFKGGWGCIWVYLGL